MYKIESKTDLPKKDEFRVTEQRVQLASAFVEPHDQRSEQC
jgi:hypothetical protein